MKRDEWIGRVIQALLVSGAEIDRDQQAQEERRRLATERFRFETLLTLVNAQTFESGAVDATLGVALAGLIALAFPLSEHASNVISGAAACMTVVPALALAFGLFRLQTESPRAVLAKKLDLSDVASIVRCARALSRGHELNREKLAGKRALLRFAVRIAAVCIFVWSAPWVWESAVVQFVLHEVHKPAVEIRPVGRRIQAGRPSAAPVRSAKTLDVRRRLGAQVTLREWIPEIVIVNRPAAR